MTAVDLDDFLADIDKSVSVELGTNPDVIDSGHSLDVEKLPIEARTWHRLTDAVAVVADMRNSTQLGVNKYPQSTASIYQASTGNIAQVFDKFDADFVAIQGDGAFGLFWGDHRYARAICAGITIKTFSYRYLVPRLEKRWPDLPETGLKVGLAASPLLVKRVGVPRTKHQEPVWAGKAVNYAAKAAQQADRHQMIVAGSIWDWANKSDYLAATCGCDGAPSTSIWEDVTIAKIPDDDGEREGKLLKSYWCVVHGNEFCNAVLAGKRTRADVTKLHQEAIKAEYAKALRVNAARQREEHRARINGMRQ
ncbi:hypothetical protein [Actinocatenispora sera]|uniref:Adenylate/guanylate cyclase domain-containing protein n=1 Tax=Actinocatenispora sera TaxID=390989 RepID=A0A810L3U8_9ACTN|nr:hypothetical protein [Actinocatenispora sera]BCJ29586.1 hypothetical protein Asera_36940 [Actinocatenispora sera]BCJ29629.1 hypothetical protein Asera_37370 [Actinocatenispora sera]BCJ29649.1 hypothetical protein Asera_37570 [Actinocatenispora sera]BCJ29669.1 hypothetical protein Asera_37770 [Actinocatenispora sera]